MEYTQQKKWQIELAALRCSEAIVAVYDEFAQLNISNLRINLSTGEPYTNKDRDEMDAFIDSKRSQYAQKKAEILACETEQAIYEVDLSYN